MGIGAILRTRAIGKPLSLASPLLDDEVSTVADPESHLGTARR